MVITTMALLTLATSNADRTMAGRFAAVTQTRYKLEADGEHFLSEAASGKSSETEFYEELEGYSITVRISPPDSTGSYDLLEWKVSKLWNSDDPVKDIWPGF